MLMSVPEVLSRVVALMWPVGRETLGIAEAGGRVLAEPVVARRTQPPFPASSMDGYAMRATEAVPGARLRVVGEAAAGRAYEGAVGEGEAVRILTGAPVPEPLDRVVIQEDVTREGDAIRLGEALDAGPYVRRAGLDFAAGAPLLDAPRRLSPEDVALAAAAGVPFVTVRRRPKVALLATGDELALPGEALGPSSITASNGFGLKALCEAAGAEAVLLPIAPDEAGALRALALEGAEADLLVTLGGASVGDHDLIRPALADAGLELDLYRIAMRPGKPFMAGRLAGTPMLGLPGNPVSAMVCGRLFVVPAIERLLGLEGAAPARERATLTVDLPPNGPREHYMRARLAMKDGRLLCTPAESQDSSRLALLSGADALAIREVGAPAAKAGEAIEVVRLR